MHPATAIALVHFVFFFFFGKVPDQHASSNPTRDRVLTSFILTVVIAPISYGILYMAGMLS